ncbi:MAG: hypothetical protein HN726_00900 [Candidatus Magasanikbacteria bacterium]|nr:hypothetical protein [Candidatus Magasanikbacteria bacterium]
MERTHSLITPWRWIVLSVIAVLFLYTIPVGAAGIETERSIVVDGVNRDFIEYQPDGYDENQAYPVLFIFHGHRGNARGAMNNYDLQQLADQEGFIVIAPDSLTPPSHDFVVDIPFVGQQTVFQNYDLTGKRWEIAEMQQPLINRCTSGDINLVEGIVNTLKQEHNIVNSHIFAAGHSQGAVFAYYVAMCSEDITGFWSQSGGLVDILNDQQVLGSISTELRDLIDLVKTFPSALFESIMGIPQEELMYPIPVLVDRDIPAAILHSRVDQVVSYDRSVLLQADLERVGAPVLFTTNPDAFGHGWDKRENDAQWQFLVEQAGPLPERTPPTWAPSIFTVLGPFNSILFEHATESLWTMLFDYDIDEVEQLIDMRYGPFAGFTAIDVEVDWMEPDYFWWTMWKHEDGSTGLWRQRSDGNKQRFVRLQTTPDRVAKDLALDFRGRPVVAWQHNDGTLEIQQLRKSGRVRKVNTLSPPSENAEVISFVSDEKNTWRVLWQLENGDIEVWHVVGNAIANQYTYNSPEGFVAKDLEIGWNNGDVLNRIFWVHESGDARIWRVHPTSGEIMSDFGVDVPNRFQGVEIETDMFDQIRILTVHEYLGISKVITINPLSGEVVGVEKTYQVTE